MPASSNGRHAAARSRHRRGQTLRLERLEARLALDGSDHLSDLVYCSFDHDHDHDHDEELRVASVMHENGLVSLSSDDRIVAGGSSLSSVGSLDAWSFAVSTNAAGLPLLNSLPGAPTAIYLDFDGHGKLGAYDVDGNPASFNATEAATITEAHRQVSVYYAMFDVNVTTVRPPNLTQMPTAWIVISNDVTGGQSYVGVFPNDKPESWIDSQSARTRASGIAHEIGHNFGLYHQSDYDTEGKKTSEYSNGLGPLHGALMGVDYREDVNKWTLGHPGTSASALQDDIAVIASQIKRFQPPGGDGFRADDHGGTREDATSLPAFTGSRSASGIIERMTDVDMFSFTTSGTGAVISVVPRRPSGLDAKLEVFDATGALVAASDGAANEQQVVIPAGTGTWYVSVSSHGDYSDLGLYDLRVNDLPAGWTSADVGNINRLPGDATYAAGTFTVAGSGARVGSDSDAFRFVWQTLTGDGSIVARVTQNQATDPLAKAGVMIRESLAANSKHVAMVTTASRGLQLISRSTTGAGSTIVGGSTTAAFTATYVRLERVGNVITASHSADGVKWFTFGSVSVTMGATVRIGLLTTAQDANKINTARFTKVALTGTLNPPEAVNALAAPTGVSVSQGGGASLEVRWQPVAGATGYRIERSQNGIDFTSVYNEQSTATSWTDLGLPGALRYFYRVRALVNTSRSAASAVVSAVNRPSPVTQGSIAPLSNTQLILNWRDTSGETGYRIKRSTDNVTFTQIATVAANVPSYTAGGLTAGTKYWFQISPMSATGDGNSFVVTRTTSGTQSVTELAFTSKSSTAIGIEWNAAASATSYRIDRSTNGTNFTLLATVGSGTLAYTDATVAVLGKYYYRVVALNGTTAAPPSPTIFTAAPRTVPLPAPWTGSDLGSLAGEGTTGLQQSDTLFVHISSGTAIGGPADSFRFTSQPLVGDGSIIARVSVQEATGAWAKAGVMIRESTNVDARQAVMVVSPSSGVAWQYRHNPGGNGVTEVVAADQKAPVWLKLTRVGNRFTGSWSTDGVTWTEAGSTNVSMGPTAVIGLVSTSDDATRLNRAEFTNVAVDRPPTVAVTDSLPAMSALLGEASAAQTVTVSGSGLTAEVIATAPAGFEVAADGGTFGPTARFTPAGGFVSGALSVRLAASAAAGSYAGSVTLASTGATTVSVAIPESIVFEVVSTPAFTSKSSTAIGIEWTAAAAATGYLIERSEDGTTFTPLATVAAATLAYTDASNDTTTVEVLGRYYYRVVALYGSTAAPPSPTIFTAAPRTEPLPAPWTAADIGTAAGAGATGLQEGTFIHVSSGTAIGGGPADSFRFTSQTLVGDGSIVARVTSSENTTGWAKAGIMFRESTAVDARQAVMVVSPTDGIVWQYRHNVGGNGISAVAARDEVAPIWLKLERVGNTFTGSWSADGETWTVAGSTGVLMGSTAVVGLVSTSDDATLLGRAEFTDVAVNLAPTVVAATATPDPVTGSMATLSVLGADDHGEANLSYIWSAAGPAPVTFSENGTNAAKSSVATFTKAGSYTLTATIADSSGLTATATVNVIVAQTLTAISVSPETASLETGGTRQFSALATDQFGDPLTTPPSFTWAVTGDGTITATGLFTAPATSATSTVTASALTVTGQATVTTTSTDEVVTVAEGQTRVDAGGRSGTGTLFKQGAGRLELTGANAHSGGIVVEAGELVIRDPGSLGTGVLEIRAGARVTLDTGTRQTAISRLNLSAAGTFDVATGSVLLAAGSYDLAEIRGSLLAARGTGSWSGPGITSTSVQPNTPFAVGYRLLQDGSLVVGFAAMGDANMDGRVDSDDLTTVSSSGKYGSGITDAAWWQGDFNYDDVVNLQDLISMRTSGLFGSGSYLPVMAMARAADPTTTTIVVSSS